MNLLSLFRRNNSAPVARERLQILLAHERAFVGKSDLLAILQEEIIAVIARHVTIDREKVQIKLDRGDPISTLEIDVEVPSVAAAAALRRMDRSMPAVATYGPERRAFHYSGSASRPSIMTDATLLDMPPTVPVEPVPIVPLAEPLPTPRSA
jgi:cell division topological specificity factor